MELNQNFKLCETEDVVMAEEIDLDFNIDYDESIDDIYESTDDENLPENSVFSQYELYKNLDIVLLNDEKLKSLKLIEKSRKKINFQYIYSKDVDLYNSMKFKILNRNLQKNMSKNLNIDELTYPFIIQKIGFTGLKNIKKIIKTKKIIKYRVNGKSPLCNEIL